MSSASTQDAVGQPDTNPPPSMPDPDYLSKALLTTNLAEKMDGQKLKEIASKVVEGYRSDLTSRKEWEQQNDDWMKLATQVMEQKTWPWPGAANIKYPILTTAALQFAARAYPSLVSSFDVVKAKAIGSDPAGAFAKIAQDISTHMSYQLFHEMDDWEEDMDKLCFILPIIGIAFKKTYYSGTKKKNCSELVLPKNLVVNYWAKSLECAARITHELFLTVNEIKERQMKSLYIDDDNVKIVLQGGSNDLYGHFETKDMMAGTAPPDRDDTTPRLIIEQHRFYDLDDDGYQEPYIVTVDYETETVLRITARWEKSGIQLDDKGKLIGIEPCHYFTKFSFLPNPDGGFYDLGFGLLLGGINDAANTIINQLVDAGTLSNLQGGFISKGIRIQQGPMQLMPGQWQQVNNFADDLKKGIFPLPFKEPSNVLFELLGQLIQSGKELASISEIFTGKMPGQNTPASTTMATIEQGLKVFTSIYKRIYRSMGKEFEKLYRLNAIYMPEQVNFTVDVAGTPENKTVGQSDYQSMNTQPSPQGQTFVKVIPAADPNMVSETQKLVKAQGLQELMGMGTVNPQVATARILEQQGQTDIPQLMQMPQPQPPLEVIISQAEIASKEKLANQEFQLKAMQVMNEGLERRSKATLNLAQAKALGDQAGVDMAQMQYDQQMQAEEKLMNWASMYLDSQHQNADRDAQMKQAQMQANKPTGAQ